MNYDYFRCVKLTADERSAALWIKFRAVERLGRVRARERDSTGCLIILRWREIFKFASELPCFSGALRAGIFEVHHHCRTTRCGKKLDIGCNAEDGSCATSGWDNLSRGRPNWVGALEWKEFAGGRRLFQGRKLLQGKKKNRTVLVEWSE